MKIWNVNMDKLNEDDLNDCETFMLIDYILAMRKKIKELQIEAKQIGHSFIQKGELLNKALDTIKAKEQECEELKDKLKTKARGWANVNDQILKEVNQLKAENERLQKEREKAKNYNLEYGQLLIKATNKNNKLKTENEDLKKINKANAKSYEKHWYKLEKLKQTLAEIKEIAQFACEKSVCDRNHCDYCSDGQILQKISEVE